MHHYSQSSLPSHTSDVPPPLVVQPSTVLAALCLFPRGTSPGSLGLCPQHLTDAVCDNTAPAASGCLQALTRCVNARFSFWKAESQHSSQEKQLAKHKKTHANPNHQGKEAR